MKSIRDSKLMFSSIILGILLLIVTCITSIFASEKPIEFTVATYQQPTGLVLEHFNIIQEELTEKTNGRIKLKIYWADSLLKGKEALRGLAKGVVDMAHANPNYYPKQLVLNSALSVIPVGPTEYLDIYWVFKTIDEEISEMREEYLKNNQIPLYFWVGLPKTICCTEPMKGLADFKNLKMRASNRWALSMLGGQGAIPVSVPGSDCYMALQTGVIDAVYTNLDFIVRQKMYEPAPNILLCKPIWSGAKYSININLDVWNKLPEDIQGQMREAFEAVAPRYAEIFNIEWDKCVAELAESKKDIVISRIAQEDVEKWATQPVLKEIQETWIKEAKEIGLENAGEVLEQLKGIVQRGIERSK